MDDTTITGDAQAIIATVERLGNAEIKDLDDGAICASIAVVPEGKKLESVKRFIDEYRDRPERRTGTATLADVPSFCAYLNRFKGGPSAVFAVPDRKAARLEAIIDYHAESFAGPPAFREHRAVYRFPFSDPWQKWTGANEKAMGQTDFAEFIEDNIDDLIAPPQPGENESPADIALYNLVAKLGTRMASPAQLLDLSRGLQVHAQEKVKNVVNLATGEIAVQYEVDHQSADGGKLSVPGIFLLAIPVVLNGPTYRVIARLRYRQRSGDVQWLFKLHRIDRVFDDAFRETCETVAKSTELPVFQGEPEK